MATGRIPTTANSPLTAKGDLFTFSTGSAKLAVGNNGETLVADSSATTGLRYSATPSASNPILNSAMQNWQRGTSISVPSSTNAYTADRFALSTFANCASTVSRQTTSDTTNLPNIQYCARFQRNSGQTGTTGFYVTQAFETINSIPFAGKTVTLSFYARAGANYSPTSSLLKVYIATGTGTDQPRAGAAYTGESLLINSTATLTTTWQRFTFNATLATSITELSPIFEATHTGTASTNDYFELTGVQIDIGSVALPFRTYAATIQGELAACQRYYYRITDSTSGFTSITNVGYARSTTQAYIPVVLPLQMRSITALDSSNISLLRPANDTFYTTGTFTLLSDSQTTLVQSVNYTHGSAIFTQGELLTIGNANNASAFIGFSAEL